MTRLAAAIRATLVEVDENFTRLRAVALADDAAVLQFVHDARGAPVAEAQTALQQRHTRLLFAADDLDALLNNLLVLVTAALVAKARRRFGKLLVDFRLVTRLALLRDEIDNVLNLPVRDQRALRPHQPRRA